MYLPSTPSISGQQTLRFAAKGTVAGLQRSATGRMTHESFSALFTRIAAGDRVAFAEVYDRLAPTVHRVAVQHDLHGPDIDDLVGRVFQRLWRTAPGFSGSMHRPPTWFLRILDECLQSAVAERSTSTEPITSVRADRSAPPGGRAPQR